jgi:hypothetical protein
MRSKGDKPVCEVTLAPPRDGEPARLIVTDLYTGHSEGWELSPGVRLAVADKDTYRAIEDARNALLCVARGEDYPGDGDLRSLAGRLDRVLAENEPAQPEPAPEREGEYEVEWTVEATDTYRARFTREELEESGAEVREDGTVGPMEYGMVEALDLPGLEEQDNLFGGEVPERYITGVRKVS